MRSHRSITIRRSALWVRSRLDPSPRWTRLGRRGCVLRQDLLAERDAVATDRNSVRPTDEPPSTTYGSVVWSFAEGTVHVCQCLPARERGLAHLTVDDDGVVTAAFGLATCVGLNDW